MPRPFLNSGIEQLEVMFDQNSGDPTLLSLILFELQYRTTSRANILRQRLVGKLNQIAQDGCGPEKRAGDRRQLARRNLQRLFV